MLFFAFCTPDCTCNVKHKKNKKDEAIVTKYFKKMEALSEYKLQEEFEERIRIVSNSVLTKRNSWSMDPL